MDITYSTTACRFNLLAAGIRTVTVVYVAPFTHREWTERNRTRTISYWLAVHEEGDIAVAAVLEKVPEVFIDAAVFAIDGDDELTWAQLSFCIAPRCTRRHGTNLDAGTIIGFVKGHTKMFDACAGNG